MNFEQYLLEIGESACSAERRIELYNNFRKTQLRSNQKKRRKGKKRLELSFTLEQYEAFQLDATKLHISVTKLIQSVIDRGYKQEVFVMLSHDLLREIQACLIQCATSMRQISFHINTKTHNQVHHADMERLKQEFQQLQNVFMRFCTPVSLEAFFRSEYAKNPRFLEHSQMILDAIKKELDVH
ncbi:hypothetical protein EZY14_007415 [Kordia sp. TARA_039_SRF]|nr:hypothetical protein EZY14_007415 [Kordia sp. TARA_039_SRF]